MKRWRWVYVLVQVPTLVTVLGAYQWFTSGVDPLLSRQWPLVGCLVLIIAISRGVIRRSRLRRRALVVAIPAQCVALSLHQIVEGFAVRSEAGRVPDIWAAFAVASAWIVVCVVSYGVALYLLVRSRSRLKATRALPGERA